MKHLRGSVFGLLAIGLALSAFPAAAFADDGDENADTEEAVDDTDASSTEISDTDPSAVVIFRSKLDPYGSWIDHPVYGTIWVPNSAAVGADFAPYVSSGHWALTDDGDWLWVSDYDWGYIPFHYGRWVWVTDVGWAWIPGRVYAPAWVVWRVGDGGYIGWAAMPPAYYWVDGYAVAIWAVPPAAFVFCHTTYVFHDHVRTYVIHDRNDVHTAVSHTHGYHAAHANHHHAASPTLTDAGVRAKDAPKMRAKGDPRALHYMDRDIAKPSSPTAKAPTKRPGASKAAADGRAAVSDTSRSGTQKGVVKRGGRDVGSTASAGKVPRARRVAPIVGQRVDAARSSSRDAARGTTTIPGRTTRVSRPSNQAPSTFPRANPSVPRGSTSGAPSGAANVKKKIVPAPVVVPTGRRATPSRPHRR